MSNSVRQWKRRSLKLYSGTITFQHFYCFFLFLLKCKLENCTYNNTLYSSDKNVSNIMTLLNHDFAILSNWFYINFMVLNPDKCYYMLFDIKDGLQTDLASNNITIKNSNEEKASEITFDNKFDFSMDLASIT